MRLLTAYLMNGSRLLDGTPVAEIILESYEGVNSQTKARKNVVEFRFFAQKEGVQSLMDSLKGTYEWLEKLELAEPLAEVKP